MTSCWTYRFIVAASRPLSWLVLAGFALLATPSHPAELALTQGTNFSVDVSVGDGRIAMDLLGHIWIVPARGGDARAVGNNTGSAARPRWSPRSDSILYEARAPGASQLWLLNPKTGESRKLSDSGFFDRQASWHPDGEKIVFSSPRGDSGFDIWQQDIESGLATPISRHPGNESEPVWSADGRALAYIRQEHDTWSLIVNRNGQEQVIVTTWDQLQSVSWRPDGTLLMYQRHDREGVTLEMAILADTPIIRTYANSEDFFPSAVSWKNRSQFIYASDGFIKQRNFDARGSLRISFRAYVDDLRTKRTRTRLIRTLPVIDAPNSRLIIRGDRIFDGINPSYLSDQDILIGDGRIIDLVPRQDWPDETVLDLGDVTILPGFIDSYATLPKGSIESTGPLLLSLGITTLVAANDELPGDFDSWNSKATPGPRVLGSIAASQPVPAKIPNNLALVRVPGLATLSTEQRANIEKWRNTGLPLLVNSWQAGLGLNADLVLGMQSMPTSPAGKRYQDLQLGSDDEPITLVSGLADSDTPGVQALMDSTQGSLLHNDFRLTPHPGVAASFGDNQSAIILGSQPNGLPAGLALHAELRAMQAAGLTPTTALQSAGANAASALGFVTSLGRVQPGALADLVIVSGDPLEDVADAFNIIAVIRNGRIFSAASLLDRTIAAKTVE